MRINLPRYINNQRGDAFMLALVLVALCLASSLLMMSFSLSIEAGSKRPRIKSLMSSVEAKVRAALLTPGNYTDCVSSDVISTRANCKLNAASITGLSVLIPDAKCQTNVAACGIRVTITAPFTMQGVGANTVTRGRVRIAYEGTDLPLRPIDVDMDVPADILQSAGIYQCPTSAPKFNGFLPDGRMDCRTLTPKFGTNEFIKNVDQNGLAATPGSLPANDFVCPADQFFDSVKWANGGVDIVSHCTPRIDPFSAYGFSPKDKADGGDIIYQP